MFDTSKNNESGTRTDALTEQIFKLNYTKTEEEFKEYDKIMHEEIEAQTKAESASINKQRTINELKYIDTKIRLMNQMSEEMTNDYNKYSQIVGKIQELSKQRQLIEDYQHRLTIDEEKKKAVAEGRIDPSEIDFYASHEAREHLDDLKRNIVKTKQSNNIQSEYRIDITRRKSVEFTLPESQAANENHYDDQDEEVLSDMRESEEKRLKKILRGSSSPLNQSTGSQSKTSKVADVLRDVFDELNVDLDDPDLDSDKIDQILELSMTPRREHSPVKPRTPSPRKPPSSTASQASSKSKLTTITKKRTEVEIPKIRSRVDELNRSPSKTIASTPSTTARNNMSTTRTATGSSASSPRKFDRKVSPIVHKERLMQEKRELQKERFIRQREHDAELLLEEIFVENFEIEEALASYRLTTPRNVISSPAVSARPKSKSPTLKKPQKTAPKKTSTVGKKPSSVSPAAKRKPIPVVKVPPLALNKQRKQSPSKDRLDMSIEIAQKENKKPSLMAQTIMELSYQETLKQNEAERVLKELENRAKNLVKSKSDARMAASQTKPPVRIIKSFTDYVHLRDPEKLRTRTAHKPLTYTEQLKMHQEQTVNVEPNVKEVFKVYGSQRVPGLFKSYSKTGKRQTKTYAERLKDLKPAESQAIVRDTPSSSNNINNHTVLINNRNSVNSSKLNASGSANGKGRHDLKTKARVDTISQVNKSMNQQRRFKPYDTHQLDSTVDLNEELDLSTWTLDDDMKRILYDDEPVKRTGVRRGSYTINKNTSFGNKTHKQQVDSTKKKVTYRDDDEDTLADLDGNILLEDLLEDERKNEKVYEDICRELETMERSGVVKVNNNVDEKEVNEYLNQVDLEDLSLSSESALSSYIDWDQIDQLINKF